MTWAPSTLPVEVVLDEPQARPKPMGIDTHRPTGAAPRPEPPGTHAAALRRCDVPGHAHSGRIMTQLWPTASRHHACVMRTTVDLPEDIHRVASRTGLQTASIGHIVTRDDARSLED